jgi:hypothetical protein
VDVWTVLEAFGFGYDAGQAIAALITGTPTQEDRIEANTNMTFAAVMALWDDLQARIKAVSDKIDDLSSGMVDAIAVTNGKIDAVKDQADAILIAVAQGVVENTAPQWYTAPNNPADADIAAAVWDADTPHMDDSTGLPTVSTARYVLGVAMNAAVQTGLWHGGGIPGCEQFSLFFADIQDYYTWVGGVGAPNTSSAYPAAIDPTLVQPGDTVLSYLQREQSGFGWTDSANSALGVAGRAVSLQLGEGGTLFYVCDVTDVELASIWREPTLPLIENPNTPPVWPGVANVELGEPVALTNGLELVAPMDGVLIAVTGTPTSATRFMFGTYSSWRYLGAAMFESDSGHSEWPITLGPSSGLIVPRNMTRAAAVRFRINPGYTGTVRTWTRS